MRYTNLRFIIIIIIIIIIISLIAKMYDAKNNKRLCSYDPMALYKICLLLSHTRTVVRECCKDDDQSQWERPKFDPPPHLNPLTDRHQNLPT